jgi:dTDP-4-dehydrorhamnose reductase
LTQRATTKAIIDEATPDCIVNLAALTNVDRCEAEPNEAYLQNTRIVENLVVSLQEPRVRSHLVQISTDQLYDGLGPHQEDRVTLANYYAFSKYSAELAAARVSSTVLRTNFFGRSRHEDRRSFSDWIVNAVNGVDRVPVFDDIQFSPLSLESLAGFICVVLDKRVTGVFNLGSRDGMSKADFCFLIAESLGLPAENIVRTPSSQLALKAYRPKDMRMDSRRFEAAFGVSMPTLREEIESMTRYYHARSRTSP